MMSKIESLKERIKKNFKDNKVLLFVFITVWVVTIVVTLSFYKTTLGKQSIGNEGSQKVVELNNKTTVQEEIKVEEIDLTKSIAIKFATYARINKGNVFINVTGKETKNEYVNETVDVSDIQDNDFYVIEFNNQLDANKEKTIIITLSSDSESDVAAGVYCSNNKAFDSSTLTINKVKNDGDLSVRFLLDSSDLTGFYKGIMIWVISTFTIIILLMLLVNPKLEVIFTMLAIVFGLTFLVIITPMSVPDETAHYEYSFQLSNMIMGEKDYKYFDNEYQNYGSFAGHYNISAAYTRLVNKFNRPLSLDGYKVEMGANIKESYTTPFVPQALGITLARLLNLNMLKTFYLGRLFNLIFYVVCVYLAIKRTPIHKMLFGIIATMPIFIQQAASFSYDCFINGLSILLISCVLKWMYQEEKIDIKDFIFVFIVNLLIAPIKVVYSLFSFLFWFVPSEKFGSKKNKIIGTLIVTAPAMYELAVLLFPLIFRVFRKLFESITNTIYADTGENNYTYAESYGEDEIYSFSYITSHPLEALELMARSIRYGIKFWFYGAFGRTLSGNTLVLPINLVHAMLVFFIAVSFREETFAEPISFKVVSIGLCIIAGLMMLGGMLISWTPMEQEIIEDYGGPIIQGMQGRYFCPLLPYCFMLFNNKKIKLPKKIDKYAIFIYLIMLFEVIVYVLSYTFVN